MTQSAEQASIDEQAALWHARLDAADMDWDAFGLWLDADPRHREAYDAIALLDADITDHRDQIATLLPANDRSEAPAKPRGIGFWRIGGGMAVAAAIAAIVAPQLPFFATEALVAYRSGAEGTQTLHLKDGSSIILDRNSALAMRKDGSEIQMAQGSAYFDIKHDPSRTLTIKLGDYEVRDIGTRFDVTRIKDHIAVAVAEGQVTVGPAGSAGSVLASGHRIDISPRTDEAVIRKVDTANIGRWQDGRLVYQNSPLALVAVDLSRYAGRTVSADPSVADMRVSGVFTIGDGSRLVGQIEALLPVKALVEGGGVRFVRARTR
ncbi:FecR domain-containing protein [Sphingomonadaceae bacterium G21617-S1]|nr:FecR domain-containing protein [Sphingomonadaceae bacterium G21617-S1]